MTVQLGKKILGGLLMLAAVGSMSHYKGEMADVITAAVMFAIGAALFLWGFRRQVPANRR